MTDKLKKAVNDVNNMVDEWFIREEENVGTVIGSLLNVIVSAVIEIEEKDKRIAKLEDIIKRARKKVKEFDKSDEYDAFCASQEIDNILSEAEVKDE